MCRLASKQNKKKTCNPRRLLSHKLFAVNIKIDWRYKFFFVSKLFRSVTMRRQKIPCGYENADGSICDQDFTRNGNRIRHIRSAHSGYIYSCGSESCGFWSISPTRVSDHKSSQHVQRNGEVLPEMKLTITHCDTCGYNFRNAVFYGDHLELCVSDFRLRVWVSDLANCIISIKLKHDL